MSAQNRLRYQHMILYFFPIYFSTYLNILPFVLIFGVATSLSALNKSMPHHVSSKVNIQVFNSQPSTIYLNNILEGIFLADDCPFHLGGRLFALFLDVFLFYDFSVTGFIQNFKVFTLFLSYENINFNIEYILVCYVGTFQSWFTLSFMHK